MTCKKTRISVTLTEAYLSPVDQFVEEGIYFTRGDAVMAGLRLLFRNHNLKFKVEEDIQ